MLLFGFSYLFGLTGTTNIAGILEVFHNAEDTTRVSALAQVAMLAIAAGLGFRVTAAPFHFYAPDVFQGTSTSGAAFLSYIPKIAGFVAFIRVFGFVAPAAVHVPNDAFAGAGISDQVPKLFWLLAALTMVVGNVFALLQDNLKRLLAYSSIAHAGYMLVGLAAAPYLSAPDSAANGVSAVLFYLVAYGTMTFGIFALILMLHRPERPVETVDDLAGLSQSHPWIALMTTVLLLSLIGFLLTVGFTGKFLLFFGALAVQVPEADAGWLYPTLAVIGMLSAAVGAWYYLRIIAVMYLRSTVKPITTRGSIAALVALIVCVILTFALSIPPAAGWVLGATRPATSLKADR
jgi:NADH-quinone oxidoreductase subunit N